MIYKDERGEIIDVAEMDFKALQIITSKKGTIRSNHYHKVGGHLLYVLSGKMRYIEREVGRDYPVTEERIINAGESVFTGPMLAHATEFLEDTVLVCCATVQRSGAAYGDDLVPCKLL
jgi:quercetin dioxygenase-like cupin family protein